MKIYCCKCEKRVDSEKVKGDVIYPHRKDLKYLTFWQCPTCKNYVGSHKKSKMPLGSIPDSKMRKLRNILHSLIDPIWKSNKMTRRQVYSEISKNLGYEFHAATTNTEEEFKQIATIVDKIKVQLETQTV